MFEKARKAKFDKGTYNKLTISNGDKYGKLVIINEVTPHVSPCGQRQRKFLCKCECGKESKVLLCNLRRQTKSCGCLFQETVRSHLQSGTKLYKVWSSMKDRCNNTNNKNFHNYGGRGIKVCKRWQKFDNFYEDIKSIYRHGLSIDRIDNNKGYFRSNIRMATQKQQTRNTRTNRMVTYKNKSITLAELSEITGKPATSLGQQLGFYK